MERFEVDDAKIAAFRDEMRGFYPDFEQPVPGSKLRLDDQVMWIDWAPAHVVWGHDDPNACNCYVPLLWDGACFTLVASDFTDRAPADPNEQPPHMPIWPEPETGGEGGEGGGMTAMSAQAAPSGGEGGNAKAEAKASDPRRALQAALKQLDPEQRRQVRERIRQVRPDLLTGQQI